MILDKFHIFEEIKTKILECYPNVEVWAFGSRTTGMSKAGLWDFDIMIYGVDFSEYGTINKIMKCKFENRIDENDRKIKVDIVLNNNKIRNNGIRL